ncbi:MAG: ergothioneine biosynthesis protein EgtB [Gammaproteobacteria bacterium]
MAHQSPIGSDPNPGATAPGSAGFAADFRAIRQQSVELTRTLAAEDMVIQTMPDASPTKWHLAHVSWFFERFILGQHLDGYRPFDKRYDFLFNSYYYTAGQMHARPRRGLLSRPTVAEIFDYRAYVDEHMEHLLSTRDDQDFEFLLTLGLNHEQQHQELMLTDIKHVFASNPLEPAWRPAPETRAGAAGPMSYVGFSGGVVEIGNGDGGFCFDNETPRHRAWLEDFQIATRPVSNAEYREFIRDGGYQAPELWLSDGWAVIQTDDWRRPLYWDQALETEFTLGGRREIDGEAPVCHLSYYEADAFARWAGARLPTEAEWEVVAGEFPVAGNFADSGSFHPRPAPGSGPRQLFGDVWEWTASAYAPYPGFRPLAGSLGEYNGKFMCSQMVLRGGSCVTPAGHVRPSYRNFFYPHQRWQFSGLRLARDV